MVSDPTLEPRAGPCDEGKRCAETLFFDDLRQHNLGAKVVGIFKFYRPRMNPKDSQELSNFVVSALTGTPITIYGSERLLFRAQSVLATRVSSKCSNLRRRFFS